MARGDYYDVWLRGEAKARRVQATRLGGEVDIDMGDATNQTSGFGKATQSTGYQPKDFVEVAELNKAGQAVRIFRFARHEVVAIEQGTEQIKRGSK